MKTLSALSLVFLVLATPVFAHSGHAHTYMGTVTMLHAPSEFMIRTTDEKDVTIVTTKDTRFLRSDDHAATNDELAVGTRVVVKMMKDGKTADSVKMSIPQAKK
jgi:hypothetical protein